MKIELDIPDGIICAFLNGVQVDGTYAMRMVSYSISSDELKDGSVIKLPRKQGENNG